MCNYKLYDACEWPNGTFQCKKTNIRICYCDNQFSFDMIKWNDIKSVCMFVCILVVVVMKIELGQRAQ